MRLGLVALVVALALAVLPTPSPAQVPSGPLTIHVEAVLEVPTSVGARTVFPVIGTARLAGLFEGQSDVNGTIISPQKGSVEHPSDGCTH